MIMTYQEVLENARKTILNCKVCPECNGLACGNTLPGPGSKAPGNGAHENWKGWKAIRLNVDTFAPDTAVDTQMDLFGHRFSLPILTGPIGSMTQYSREDVTVGFNAAMIRACAETGIVDCFGDGIVEKTVAGALEAVAEHPDCAIPVFNPLPNAQICEKIERFESSGTLATCVVVDSAGLSHWKFKGEGPGSKTVEDLKFLKSCTKKPFLIKGIMTAKAALKAVEAGADGIIVSNHGGRVQGACPSTAEVLPSIVEAVKGQTVIFVDGGIRSGVDVFRALALGADAVLVGRPFATMLYGAGQEGVKVLADKLTGELKGTMKMCGAASLAEITREKIRF